MQQYNTFIVRIWTGNSDEFHGQIKHIASQEQIGFRELSHITEFILEQLRHPKNQAAFFQGNDRNGEET